MRNWLARFFYGRNGMDALCKLLMWVGIGAYLVSMLLMRLAGGIPGTILWALCLLCLVLSILRAMSRNLPKRQKENARYFALRSRVVGGFKGNKERFSQRRDYKFFRCPDCRTMLRVPRGKGKIQVTCRKCGTRFSAKS